MPMLSKERKNFLMEASKRYNEALPGSLADEYLESRGLDQAPEFGLGYVADPLPGHEIYRGMLAIPYMRRSATGKVSVAGIKFRRLKVHGDQHKYLLPAGDQPRLYNTPAIMSTHDVIGIAEGEIDAMSVSVAGIPCVGVPGVKAWKPHFVIPFEGYEVVYVFADNDDAGQGLEFAGEVAKRLPNARVIPWAPGHDANSTLVEFGAQAIKEKIQ